MFHLFFFFFDLIKYYSNTKICKVYVQYIWCTIKTQLIEKNDDDNNLQTIF